MKYQQIRKFSYKTEKKVLRSRPHNFDMNNWFKSPYTCLKIRFYIEFSSLFVYLIQNSKIKPNHISYIYALAGLLGGVFISINSNNFIIAGIFIIFFKVAIDGADGLLARVKYKPSNFGSAIDSWGGLVGEYSFIVGFGFYIFNMTQNQNYIYLTFVIVLLKALDLKNYVLYYIGTIKSQKISLTNEKSQKTNISQKKTRGIGKLFNFFKNIVKNGFNYQAKTVDTILLIILIEINYQQIFISQYFFYLFLIRGIIIFFGDIFLAQKENFLMNVAKNKIKYKNNN